MGNLKDSHQGTSKHESHASVRTAVEVRAASLLRDDAQRRVKKFLLSQLLCPVPLESCLYFRARARVFSRRVTKRMDAGSRGNSNAFATVTVYRLKFAQVMQPAGISPGGLSFAGNDEIARAARTPLSLVAIISLVHPPLSPFFVGTSAFDSWPLTSARFDSLSRNFVETLLPELLEIFKQEGLKSGSD